VSSLTLRAEHIHVYTRVCLRSYVCVFVSMYDPMYVYMFMYMYTRVCMCTISYIAVMPAHRCSPRPRYACRQQYRPL